MQRKLAKPHPIVRGIRGLLRRNRLAFRIVHRWRSQKDERAYRRLRDRYARMAPPWLDWDAEKARQRALLGRVWTGPARVHERCGDVRIFLVTSELDTTPTFAPELQRSFDADVFNTVAYLPSRPRPNALEWRDRLQRDLLEGFLRAHEREPFDLAFLYVSHFECAPSTLLTIREAGVPAAVYWMDDKHSFLEKSGVPNGQRPLSGAASLHLTTSLECVRWYTAEGAPAYYMPEAADPEVFRPLDLPKDIQVSFVGGWYGGRRELIARLRAAGIEVRCWGPETEGGLVSREEVVRIFNRSRINLGFGGIGSTAAVTHLKTRDYEVPMSGNLYLTLYNSELADQFDIGREILCYLNDVDCAEQIRFWLAQADRARDVGRAARARSLRDHTWTRRISDLLGWMGILDLSGGSA